MSWPDGSWCIRAFAVKSLSGKASMKTVFLMSLKESSVATSKKTRLGRSTRAQTTPELVDTSPDCSPCVITGRLAARLMLGNAMPPDKLARPAALPVASRRRRVMRREDVLVIAEPRLLASTWTYSVNLTERRQALHR